ncbi:MAG: hypothetical protein HYY84_17095 [Deltaproteobacteria bacterium]|nr:hypothetical protein [Deltaproteobacteria bacterium]
MKKGLELFGMFLGFAFAGCGVGADDELDSAPADKTIASRSFAAKMVINAQIEDDSIGTNHLLMADLNADATNHLLIADLNADAKASATMSVLRREKMAPSCGGNPKSLPSHVTCCLDTGACMTCGFSNSAICCDDTNELNRTPGCR